MKEETDDTIEVPKVIKSIVWPLIWFAAVVAARLLVIPAAGWMDESNRYLLIRPVAFASDVTMFVAGFILVRKFVFPRTLAKDSGTRFNQAFKSINDPFRLMMVYAAFTAPIIIAIAMIMQNTV